MYYKVTTTAYEPNDKHPLVYLGKVHRIVGSLATAELAAKRNLATIEQLHPGAIYITRKEVHA